VVALTGYMRDSTAFAFAFVQSRSRCAGTSPPALQPHIESPVSTPVLTGHADREYITDDVVDDLRPLALARGRNHTDATTLHD